MITADLSAVERPQRLVAVQRSLQLTDALKDRLDGIARLAAEVLDVRYGFVTVIDRTVETLAGRSDLSWPTSLEAHGGAALCALVVTTGAVVVIGDARTDERISAHPVVRAGGIGFCGGAPIHAASGLVLGAVCAADPSARSGALSERQVVSLQDLADEVAALLQLASREAEQAAQRRVLASIAAGDALPVTLDRLAREVEGLVGGGVQCSIMLVDPEHQVLRSAAAPSLDPTLRAALDGTAIGGRNGTCAEATESRVTVVAEDLSTYPNPHIRRLTKRFHVGAVASLPVLDSAGSTPLGVFTLFRSEPGVPDDYEWAVLRDYCDLTRVVIEQARGQEELVRLATEDPVTGLLNRSAFLAQARSSLLHAPAPGCDHVLLFCDTDHFKLVNDSFGHAAGDAYLLTAGERLRARVRPADLVARYAGDAFTVLALDVPVEKVRDLAGRAVSAFTAPLDVEGHDLTLSASVGAATGTVSGLDVEALLSDADLAMHAAKSAGRGRAQVCDLGLRAEARSRNELVLALRQAVADDAITVVYQPEVDLATGDVVGVEALSRWDRAGHGAVSPVEFIPAAEQSGLIGSLGRRVLDRALADLARWRDRSVQARRLTMWVNVSARQLDPALLSEVDAALRRHTLPAGCLGVEVTESAVMSDAVTARAVLQRLRDRGVRVAVDDFGTGHSSLSLLKDLPVDVLKIDRSFVTGLADGGSDRQLVTAILAMADALVLSVVAEGVETPAQRRALHELGCPTAQGYLLGMPQAATAIDALLAAPAIALASPRSR